MFSLPAVDIGWPCGLCVLAINTFLYSHGGNDTRTALVCGALLFHGGRMFVVAMALFYPYRFKEDLSRYQYARTRFIQETDKPGSLSRHDHSPTSLTTALRLLSHNS